MALSQNVSPQTFEQKAQTLPTQSPAPANPVPTPDTQRILNTAEQLKVKMGDQLLAIDHLLHALFEVRDVASVLESSGLNARNIEATIKEMRKGRRK